MIDLGRLRALNAVASYGTVLAASAALRCTPSAVSQQLAKLERETGSTLVEKDGRRLRLTDAGQLLAAHAVTVLAAVDEAEAALAAHQGTVTGRVTIVAFATACRGLMPYALRQLAADHPQLTTSLVEGPHSSLDALLRGHVDLAVLDDWPEAALHYPPGIGHAVLGLDVVDLAVPRDHRLAASTGPVRLTQFRDERWISAQPGAICYQWLMRVLPGVEPDFLVGEYETQLALVATGLGVAILPRLARPVLPDGVVVLPVTPPPTRRVTVAWRQASVARPAIAVALQAIREGWDRRVTAPV